MKDVLVICTGNSCRSVIAEALINHLGQGCYRAFSAGSNPTGFVHPESLAALRRHGIDPDQPRSQSWDDYTEHNFDLVITVCDQAAGEACPLLPGAPAKLHWSTPDPAKTAGSQSDIDAAFDQVVLQLQNRIEKELL